MFIERWSGSNDLVLECFCIRIEGAREGQAMQRKVLWSWSTIATVGEAVVLVVLRGLQVGDQRREKQGERKGRKGRE